ncbi:hypothetical protein WR25_12320 [Diploscapter pachys]|uniref:Nitrilase and fragile histidine triad fusion protein NitFhit n=1 Tax=Diploscapter pachys TaxID=2018661 RepID=A0A2A2JVC8_9BILA|nr:hypothetical protein WR25_12320 [Diploscapter pachys]
MSFRLFMISAISGAIRRTMSTTAANGSRHFIAVCQLTSDHDVEKNFKTCESMIERAGARKCEMIFFPECFDYVGRNKEETVGMAYDLNGEFIQRFRDLAKKHNLWMSLGGTHHKDPAEPNLPWNNHVVIDNEGKTRAEYKKIHLFDLEIPGKVRLMESEFSKAGKSMVPPVDTPVGKLGLSICYDLRFPELSIWNRKSGAQILSFPSAFTLNTGLAHWETLLRTRAIENQCYVVAAAQTGKHNEKRQSYGHAMVVDPWGHVIAQCSERVDMCFAEVDLAYVDELRLMQPVYAHRRNDLYTIHVNEQHGRILLWHFKTAYGLVYRPDCIFYESRHCFAFVNLKPVLPGHIVICPKRVAERLTDLSDEETADLFVVAKKVQKMLEKHYNVTSSTLCVQDGADAGRTVEHVHVHILPRRPNDFGPNPDDLYKKLHDHDKNDEIKPRTLEEMASEAKVYRDSMKSGHF